MSRTFLLPIEKPNGRDTVIAAGAGPMLEGRDEESLACPSCQGPLTQGVSALTISALFRPTGRLVIHCRCGAYGEVPQGEEQPTWRQLNG